MMLAMGDSPRMKGDENDGVQEMPERIVDRSVAREGTVTAIMTENEDSPHDESGKEPKEG